MTLSKLSEHISQFGSDEKSLPPVELWNPPYCGEIDLVIKANGTWLYNGSEIKRSRLIKLFASVLKREDDNYYLVTPVEKVKIVVEDAPFLLTHWQWLSADKALMQVSTNIGDTFELNSQHPMSLGVDGQLYVLVRRNLLARVHRNVFYQWVSIANEVQHDDVIELVLNSAGQEFSLGRVE